MGKLMNKTELIRWLDQQIPNADDLRNENSWRAYEAAKGEVKRNLCGGFTNLDWRTYDYYQPMLVDWAGVYK